MTTAPGKNRLFLSMHTMLMSLVALALVPVVALTLWEHFIDRQSEREQAVVRAAHAAGMVAQDLVQQTQNARLFLEMTAKNPEVRACERTRCDELLQTAATLATQYDTLLVLQADGKVLSSSQPLPQGANYARNPAVNAAAQGSPFSVGTTREVGKAVVTYAVPVYDAAGKLNMVLAAQVSLARITQIFHDAHMPEGTTLVVAGEDGRVHFRVPDVVDYYGGTLPLDHLRLVQAGTQEAEGWGLGLDGRERYYVLRRLNFCRDDVCYVRVGILKDAVYSESEAAIKRNLLALAAITVLTLLITRLWGTRHLLLPAQKLQGAVLRLGAGDLTARSGIQQGHSYLGDVAATFDQMAETMERQQAEQEEARKALKLSEERLKAVFNASADGMLLLAPGGEVLSMNDCAAARRNKLPGELIGMNILDLLPQEVRANRRERYDEVGQTGKPLRFEEEREGRTYAIRLYPIADETGTVHQIASFSRDITERKLGERALTAAKDAAESASRAKSNFLANMSHELRTPLNGILGMLQLMEDGEHGAEQREYLSWATQSAQLLAELVNDILDYAALDSGDMRLEHRTFHLQEVLTPVVTEFLPQAQAKGLVFSAQTPQELTTLPLLGDPQRLGTILRQLLSNAVKFTATGQVGLALRQLSGTEQNITLAFSVSDTGIGIEPADTARIFDPFVQAEAPLTKRFQGTGLGLAIAKELAARMGGSLTVASTPGSGSSFTLCISFHRAAPQV